MTNLVAQPVVRVEMILPPEIITMLPSAWYKADDAHLTAEVDSPLAQEGESVGYIADSSGNGRHLVQSPGNRPVLNAGLLGGKNVVHFNGVDQWMSPSTPTKMSELLGAQGTGTVFSVFAIDSDQVGAGIIWADDKAPARAASFWSGNTLISRGYDDAQGATNVSIASDVDNFHVGLWATSPNNVEDTTHILVGQDDVDSLALFNARMGAKGLYGGNFVTREGMTASMRKPLEDFYFLLRSGPNLGALLVGRNGAGSAFLKGSLAEMIFFPRALTEMERRGVALYLDRKYGLSYVSSSYIAWTEVDALASAGVTATRGITGNSFQDRVASTGTMRFDMLNFEHKWSPDHPSHLIGFDIGTEVRLRVTYDVLDKVLWRGTIAGVIPAPGKRGQRVTVNCVDYMNEAALAKLSGQPVVLNQRSDQVFDILVDAIRKPPDATFTNQGSDIYPYALDNARDEAIAVLTEFQRLAMSELGFIYVRGDGTLVYEGRRKRAVAGTPTIVFDDFNMESMNPTRQRDKVLNRVIVQSHPRRKDLANVTLFTLQNAPVIPANTSYTFQAPYRDPSQRATRVGILPGSGSVTFAINSAADGTGTDITSLAVVSATYGGNAATVIITNNSGLDGVLTSFNIVGKGLYDFETTLSVAADQDSIDQFGELSYTLDMPYQNDTGVAGDAAAYVMAQNKDPATRLDSITVKASKSDEIMRKVLQAEISDRVSVTEAETGLTAIEFFINSVTITIGPGGWMTFTFILTPADISAYWTLDVDGLTELNRSTVLGYGIFVAHWALGQSAVGVDTVVNV